MTALRVAFIGAGQMARNHCLALRHVGVPAIVVGVHDRAPYQAEQFASAAASHAFASAEDMLERAQPDVVHVCTPPAAHFDAARLALEHGAHVYVEKPFATSSADARALIDLAAARRRLVCAGHQLLLDPAFAQLMARAPELGALVQADSHFAFRPSGATARGGASALAQQLIDILPHPLYALVAVLERYGPPGAAVGIAWAHGGPTDLQAILTAGDLVGRLSVSLRARPIASTVTLTGTRAAFTADLVRSIVVGAGNPGTEALEKVLNPCVEGLQLVSRTVGSVARRLRSGVSYPGLRELIGAFYRAAANGAPPPIEPRHLLRVTELFEALTRLVDPGPSRQSVPVSNPQAAATATAKAPLVAVTGVTGFLGSHVARALGTVRGIGRGTRGHDPHVADWVAADLSRDVPPHAFAGAQVVVHAAAETGGDFDAHQRNTIEATRNLLHAMHAAGVTRLVLVSSLSVLRPPRTPWERQDEATPRPGDSRRFGPYAWGKTMQEALVEREAPPLGIAVRIVRPGALIDWSEPSLPGLMGRHLFGRWHLGLGRATLPIAVCDVGRCAAAIAWCATHFDEAPPVVNLFDPKLQTRGSLVARLRADGWTGRIVWVPISSVAFAIVAVRTVQSLLQRRLPEKVAAWGVLCPRRYDDRLATRLLAGCQ